MPSRRWFLTATTALFAGCSTTTQTQTNGTHSPNTSAQRPDSSPSSTRPSTSPSQTPTSTPAEPPSGDAIRWRFETGGSIREPPVVHDGTVYVVGGDNGRDTAPEDARYVQPNVSQNCYALTTTGEERWRYEADAGLFDVTPHADGVYAVEGWDRGMYRSEQRLFRIDAGERRWAYEPGEDMNTRLLWPLASTDDGVFVGSGDDQWGVRGESLFAFDTDGDVRWEVDAGDTTEGTVRDGTLYLTFGGRETVAFDTETGERRWTTAGRPVTDGPRLLGDSLLIRRDEEDDHGDYPLVSLSADDGHEQWRYTNPASAGGSMYPSNAVRSGSTLLGTEYDGQLFALDAETGAEHWTYDAEGETRSNLAVGGETVYTATMDGTLHAVAVDSGERRWTQSVSGRPYELSATTDGVVVGTGLKEGRGYAAFTTDGTRRWTFDHSGERLQATVDGLRVYVATESGYLCCLGGAA